ncbi:MAG: hypothetical protein JO209_07150 [Acidisphaera sp.]|nr:hypothetical protein [Acidisphaera sp.]
MRARLATAVLGAALCPAAVGAQDRPQTLPTRDVDITYRITRGGQTMQERTHWLAAGEVQRIDPPDGGDTYMIMDHHDRQVAMVNANARTVVELTAPPPGPLEPGSAAAFARGGEETVAGLTCTDWQTQAADAPAVLCLTPDGVLLRLQAAGATLVEATSVQYAPADPAEFRIPADYRHVTPQPAR